MFVSPRLPPLKHLVTRRAIRGHCLVPSVAQMACRLPKLTLHEEGGLRVDPRARISAAQDEVTLAGRWEKAVTANSRSEIIKPASSFPMARSPSTDERKIKFSAITPGRDLQKMENHMNYSPMLTVPREKLKQPRKMGDAVSSFFSTFNVLKSNLADLNHLLGSSPRGRNLEEGH